jgi:hypothetical protein
MGITLVNNTAGRPCHPGSMGEIRPAGWERLKEISYNIEKDRKRI